MGLDTIPYCGAAPVPAELWARWNLDPVLMAAMVAGFAICWHYRRDGGSAPLIAAGAILFFLWISPFCALSSALFSARSFHHLAMSALAAPLIAWALPPSIGRGLAAWTIGHAAIFWIWHLPAAYALALSHDAIFWLMQAMLLGSAVGLWRAAIASPLHAAVTALLVTMVQMGLLGGLLTFTTAPLYAPHWLTTSAWGLGPIEDQQLAGLIMWVPGAGLYLGAALFLANRWLTATRPAAA
ncbi:cytochrome c oxidase assembly protein [Sphingomonas sp. G-3-2-10]|nr:cytochrome c oxidase assembly protein [Sphingomonas sp. G-3-2-10]